MNLFDHLQSRFEMFISHYQSTSQDREMTILSRMDTLEYALQTNQSIVRFGDGELNLIRYGKYSSYKGLDFQKNNRQLSNKLENVFLRSIPNVLVTVNQVLSEPRVPIVFYYERTPKPYTWYESVHSERDIGILDREKTARAWKNLLVRYMSRSQVSTWGDATCFILGQFYNEYVDGRINKVFDLYRQFFANRQILFVSPDQPLIGQSFRDLVRKNVISSAKKVEFITIPNRDCFEFYNDILNKILKFRYTEAIFIQAGPTATVMAAELMEKHGLLSYDVGSLNVSLLKAWQVHGKTF